MESNLKKRFSVFVWISILFFLFVILTFPQWITFFYPQPHRDLVFSAAYEYGIDPYLVFAIIRAESKYQSEARSPAGARGLMQIMPETACWIAEQQGISDFNPDELNNPETNIRFGCWYLASLKQEFAGCVPLMIAAYNAGRGKVNEWVVNKKWDGDLQELEKIPFAETRRYVRNVIKNYKAYRAIYAGS